MYERPRNQRNTLNLALNQALKSILVSLEIYMAGPDIYSTDLKKILILRFTRGSRPTGAPCLAWRRLSVTRSLVLYLSMTTIPLIRLGNETALITSIITRSNTGSAAPCRTGGQFVIEELVIHSASPLSHKSTLAPGPCDVPKGCNTRRGFYTKA